MNKQLAVLHFTSPPDVGGCEVAAFALARAAAISGWNVSLLTGTESPDRSGDTSRFRVVSIVELGTRHPTSREIFHDFRVGRSCAALMPYSDVILARLIAELDRGAHLVSL